MLNRFVRKQNENYSVVLTACYIIFFMTALVLPLFVLLKQAFFDGNGVWQGIRLFQEYFSQKSTASSLQHSFHISFKSSLIASILAFFFALGVNRTRVFGRKIAYVLGLIPLLLPTLTHGLVLIYLFGRQGMVTKIYGKQLFELYGHNGIIIAMIIYLFPVLFLLFSLNLNRSDHRLYEFSDLCEISPLKQFFKITLYQQRYTLLISFSVGFVLAFSDFGIPKTIGGNYNVLSTDIYKQVIGLQNFSMGSVVSLLLLGLTLVFAQLERFFGKRNRTLDSKAVQLKVPQNRVRDIVLGSYLWLLALFFLVFISVLIYSSFIAQWPYDLSFTFDHYSARYQGGKIGGLVGQSVLVALVSAILGTLLTFLVAFSVEKEKLPLWLKNSLNLFAMMPSAIPGMVIGLSFIFFYNQRANPLSFIYGTFTILVLANIIHFFTTPYLNMLQVMKNVSKEYDDSYKVMNISRFTYLRKVIALLSLDVLVENFAYFFVNSMITISAVIFLYNAQTALVSTAMISLFDQGYDSRVAALAVLLFAINLFSRLLFVYILRFCKKSQHRDHARPVKSRSLIKMKTKLITLLSTIAREQGMDFWLDFGTLLKVYRNNQLRSFGSKLTIALKKDQLSQQLFDTLESNGIILESKMNLQDILADSEACALIFHYEQKPLLELYLFEENTKGSWCYCIEKNELVRYDFPAISLVQVNFFGIDLNIPNKVEAHLKMLYGSRFDEDDPLWDTQMASNRTVIKIKS